MTLTYNRGTAGGFAPAFKVIGWNGAAPLTVKVEGREVPAVAAVTGGNLLVQILGSFSSAKVQIELAANN